MKFCRMEENKISNNMLKTDLKYVRIHRRYKFLKKGVHFFGTLCIASEF